MFPVSSMLVSGVHMLPALGILTGGAVWAGWAPSWLAIGSMFLAFAIVAVLAMAFGLLFAAVNVFFRDFGQVVDIINIVIPWSVPMIYPWTTVQEATHGSWLLELYLASPLSSAVLLFERAFWWPTMGGSAHAAERRARPARRPARLPRPPDRTGAGQPCSARWCSWPWPS